MSSLFSTVLHISGPTEEKVQIVHIVIGTSISVFFCVLLIVCGVYHRKKFRPRDRHYPEADHVEVRYVAATSGSNTTDRLLTLDKSDISRSAVQIPDGTESNHDHCENNSVSPPPQVVVNQHNDVHEGNSNSNSNTFRNNHSSFPHEQPSSSNPRPVSAPKIQKVSIV